MNLTRIRAGAFVLGLLLPSLAFAQGTPAYQSGAMIAPHDLAKITRNGQIQDVGGLTGDASGRGANPFSVYDQLNLGACSNSALSTGQYNALCMGHDSSGNGLITLDSYGGLAQKALKFRINGVSYDFPGSGSGNVVGPTPTIVGQMAVWNNTTGTLLSRNTIYTLTTNGTISRDTFQGVQTGGDTAYQSFGAAALLMATHGNQNGIVGSVVNDAAAGTAIFPTGSTGHGKLAVGSNGNVVFGAYGQTDLYAPGIAINEFAANNWSGAPDPTLPPNQGLGTTTNIAIPIHAGCGGNFACPSLLQMAYNGANPQKGVIGLYSWPTAIRDYGIYIDADGTNGPAVASAMLKNVGTGINLILQTAALQTPANKVFDVRASTGASSFWISQAGGFTIFHQTAPATPANAGEFVVYVDAADNKLKTKSYLGTVTALALP